MTRHDRTRRTQRLGLVPALPRQAWTVLGGDFASAVGSGLTLPFLFVYAHHVRHPAPPTRRPGRAGGAGRPPRPPAGGGVGPGRVPPGAGPAPPAPARPGGELSAAAGLLGVGVSVICPPQAARRAPLAAPASRSAV